MKNCTRFIPWFAVAALCYTVALVVESHQMQTLFWKLGHVTVGVVVGYVADRAALGQIDHFEHSDYRKLARAVVIFAAVIGISGGL